MAVVKTTWESAANVGFAVFGTFRVNVTGAVRIGHTITDIKRAATTITQRTIPRSMARVAKKCREIRHRGEVFVIRANPRHGNIGVGCHVRTIGTRTARGAKTNP